MSEAPLRVSFPEALAIIAANSRPAPTELVAVADALGCILSSEVAAEDDSPRFDCSAMDGFAVSSEASAAASRDAPVRLPLAGAADAGKTRQAWAEGAAIPISTGAPMPVGCDAVLVRVRGLVMSGKLHLTEPVSARANVRHRGEDAFAGEGVMSAGSVIDPAAIGALLSFGVERVSVRRRPRFAILPTGDELREGCGDDARTRDANGPMIAASLRGVGLQGRSLDAASDDGVELGARLDDLLALSDVDTVITTGGVSAGTRDRIPSLIEARGGVVHFHGVSMRPGKPVLFATLPDGRLFFGLPGNPVAALLGCRFLILHAIRTMLGLCAEVGEVLTSVESEPSVVARFLKVLSERDGTGGTRVTLVPGQQSHRLRPLLAANAWLRVGGEGEGAPRLYPMDAVLAGR